MYPQGTATLGISAQPDEIVVIDPQLVLADSLWRLQQSGPAVDSAKGSFDFIRTDIDGQDRETLKDIGADEYTTAAIVNYPLSAEDVGPFAGLITNIDDTKTSGIPGREFNLINAYPNPFNAVIRLELSEPALKKSDLNIYNMNGQIVKKGIRKLSL